MTSAKVLAAQQRKSMTQSYLPMFSVLYSALTQMTPMCSVATKASPTKLPTHAQWREGKNVSDKEPSFLHSVTVVAVSGATPFAEPVSDKGPAARRGPPVIGGDEVRSPTSCQPPLRAAPPQARADMSRVWPKPMLGTKTGGPEGSWPRAGTFAQVLVHWPPGRDQQPRRSHHRSRSSRRSAVQRATVAACQVYVRHSSPPLLSLHKASRHGPPLGDLGRKLPGGPAAE
jgi:hypothetical protein